MKIKFLLKGKKNVSKKNLLPRDIYGNNPCHLAAQYNNNVNVFKLLNPC